MKVRDGYEIQTILQDGVLIPTSFDSMITDEMMTLSESGILLWNILEKGAEMEELILALTNEYDIDRLTAEKDVKAFIERLEEMQLLIE